MNRHRGLTLIEVLAAAALAAVLTVAAGGWLVSVQRGAVVSHAQAEREQAWQRVLAILEADCWYAESAGLAGMVSDQGHGWRIRSTHRWGPDGGPGTRMVTWAWDSATGALQRQREEAASRSLGSFPGMCRFADEQGRLRLTWRDDRGAERTWIAPAVTVDGSLLRSRP